MDIRTEPPRGEPALVDMRDPAFREDPHPLLRALREPAQVCMEINTGKAPNAKDFTNQRTRRAGGLVDEVARAKNRNKSRIRARVEHVFGVIKRLWGFGKVRYVGLHKNATRAFTALALANIFLGRQRLMAQVRP